MSRGLVVTDAAHSNDLDQFLRRYELEGIAPFTLLIYEEGRFEEMIWDGNEKFIRQPDLNTPQIWSSVTLYPETIRQKRKQLFETWLRTHPSYNREDIISFHHLSHGDAENDFIMNRNEIVKTLSITSIMTNASALSMLHISLDPSRREEILVASE